MLDAHLILNNFMFCNKLNVNNCYSNCVFVVAVVTNGYL